MTKITELNIININAGGNVDCLLFFDDVRLLCGTKKGEILIHNIKTGVFICSLRGHTNYVWTLFKIGPGHVASGGHDKIIRIWNMKTYECEKVFSNHTSPIRSIILVGKNKIASGSEDKTVGVYNWRTGEFIDSLMHDEEVWGIGYEKKKKFIISCAHKEIRAWNIRLDYQLVRSFDFGKDVGCGILIPNSSLFAIGCKDGTIIMLNITSWNIDYTFNYHSNFVNRLLYVSPNFLFSASDDMCVKIFNLERKTCEITLTQHGSNCYTVAVSNDGKIVIGGKNCDHVTSLRLNIELDGNTNVFNYDFISVEVENNFEYLMKNFDDFYDFTIKLKNGDIKIFKSLLISSPYLKKKQFRNEMIELDESVNVDKTVLLKILLGFDVKIMKKDLFDFYVLFRSLGMKDYCFLICKKINEQMKMKELILLYKIAYEKYEKSDEMEIEIENLDHLDEIIKNEKEKGDIVFNSAFTLQIFNVFKAKEKDILEKKVFIKIFERLKLFSKLKEFKERDFFKHREFDYFDVFGKKTSTKIPKSFYRIAEDRTKELFSTRFFSNSIIRSSDGRNFDVHKEFLILKSQFFQKMVSFKGVESTSLSEKGEIKLEYLDSEPTEALLEYIYLNKISSSDFHVLFLLLNHSTMYLDFDLKLLLIKKIKDLSVSILEEGKLTKLLRKVGYLLENDENVEILINYWTRFSKITKSTILDVICQSRNDVRINIIEKNFFEMTKEVEKLKEEKNSISKRVLLLEKENKRLFELVNHAKKKNDIEKAKSMTSSRSVPKIKSKRKVKSTPKKK